MWKICIKDSFLNCGKIYPIQQKKIKEMVDLLRLNRNVLKIYVFGSSISNRCSINSDVDIYIELEEEENKLIKKYLPFSYDLWTNYTVDENLKKEIMKECVLVYKHQGRKPTTLEWWDECHLID